MRIILFIVQSGCTCHHTVWQASAGRDKNSMEPLNISHSCNATLINSFCCPRLHTLCCFYLLQQCVRVCVRESCVCVFKCAAFVVRWGWVMSCLIFLSCVRHFLKFEINGVRPKAAHQTICTTPEISCSHTFASLAQERMQEGLSLSSVSTFRHSPWRNSTAELLADRHTPTK